MKFKIGDKVIVTSGKDKSKKSEITAVFPKENKVLVKDVNNYVKHIKAQGERKGERIVKERPLSVAKIAVLNDKGQADRIAYKLTGKDKKVRIFRKTGKVIPDNNNQEMKKK